MASISSRALELLFTRARAGSKSAFGRLLAFHRPWLERRARRLLPKSLLRKKDASDLVRETEAYALSNAAKFEGSHLGSLGAWLMAKELRFGGGSI